MKTDVIGLVSKNCDLILDLITRKYYDRISKEETDRRIYELEDEINRVDAELGIEFLSNGSVHFNSKKPLPEHMDLLGKRMLLQEELMSLCDRDWVEENLGDER